MMNQTLGGGRAIQVNGDASGLVAGGDIHYTTASDGYTPMTMERASTMRAWLPDNWLGAAAAAAGVLGLLLDARWSRTGWAPWLMLAFIALIAGGVSVPLLRDRLAKTRCIPLWGWVIELGADNQVYLSQAVGTCPRCGRRMHLRRIRQGERPSYYIWDCESGVTMHNLLFDPTEFSKSWP